MRNVIRGGAICGAVGLIALAVNAHVRPARPSSARIRLIDSENVIRQRRSDDCGIAVIAMLLRAVGTPVDLDRLWAEGGPTPRGESLRGLATLASQHGVQIAPVSYAPLQHAALRTPWIAHLSWNHYVLVESDAGGTIVVADPRGGRYAYTADAFERAWSGYGLRLESRPN